MSLISPSKIKLARKDAAEIYCNIAVLCHDYASKFMIYTNTPNRECRNYFELSSGERQMPLAGLGSLDV